jgi:NTP pyrophosphatase (non-canonical NTP hydrolase)
MTMMIYESQALLIHDTAREKGFWDADTDINFVLGKLALVHSEVSETLEAVRKQQGDYKVVEEMADIIIRLLDLYAGMKRTGWIAGDVYLDGVIAEKMAINSERPRLHGNLA